jgi:hypothetical protein
MLPKGIWQQHEPRAVVPLFGDAENFVDFAVQPSFAAKPRSFIEPLYYLYQRKKTLTSAARDYFNLLLRRPLAFRAVMATRDGRYLGQWPLAEGLRVGDFFSVNVNELMVGSGIKPCDGLLILVASRGRTDLWNSSPGSANVRYVGKHYVAGFRTGLFVRTLNPAQGSKHFGFTGLNPQVRLNGREVPGVLLINHSSDPEYDRTVSPISRLHRSREEFLEAPFGSIAPHGALERSVPDLFPDAAEFLAPNAGRGYLVTRNKGASLASLHLIRSRDGRSMALDHSRPAHTNVVAYF